MTPLTRLLALLALFAATAVQAAQYRDFDGYRVHYSAFNSTLIDPSVAKVYDVRRSNYRGVINIVVQKQGTDAVWPSAPAEVRATATNLSGQVRRIDIRRIEEGQAVYYLGEFPVANQEQLSFDVQIAPQEAQRTFNLTFRQQFFTRD